MAMGLSNNTAKEEELEKNAGSIAKAIKKYMDGSKQESLDHV